MILIEDGAQGGFGSAVLHYLLSEGYLDSSSQKDGLRVRALNLPDIFQDHASQKKLYADAGLDADAIIATAIGLVHPADTKDIPLLSSRDHASYRGLLSGSRAPANGLLHKVADA